MRRICYRQKRTDRVKYIAVARCLCSLGKTEIDNEREKRKAKKRRKRVISEHKTKTKKRRIIHFLSL